MQISFPRVWQCWAMESDEEASQRGGFGLVLNLVVLLFGGDLKVFVVWHEWSEHKEGPNESVDFMEENHGGYHR